MTIEQLLTRLPSVRQNGAGWIARCPAHPDRSPSFSVGERDGKVLLHCFAGCSFERICEALGIKPSDLFAGPGVSQPKPNVVRQAEKQISDLRGRLTARERVLPVSVVYCNRENLDAGIARALALAIEGEIVQAVLEGRP